MILPKLKTILLVEDEWTPDEECPNELILRDVHGNAWSVSIMRFNYMHTESKANKISMAGDEVKEGESDEN